MVGPKKQDFWPTINILRGFFLNLLINYGCIKKCQNCTFKVNVKNQLNFLKRTLGLGQIYWTKD